MLRLGPLCAFILAGLPACGKLTEVPPPPVPLGAIEAPALAVDGDSAGTLKTTGSRLLNATPPRALLTLHLPDIGGAIRRFKQTKLYRVLVSPEMGTLLGQFNATFKNFQLPETSSTGVGSGPDPSRLFRALKGELVVSLEEVHLDRSGRPDSVRLLAAVSVRGAERDAEALVQLVSMMAASDERMQVEKGSREGSAFVRLVGKHPIPYVLEMSVHRDALLIGIGRETVTSALTRLESNGAGSLAANPDFVRSMKMCSHTNDALRVHVDVAGVVSRFSGLIPEEARHVMEVLGVDRYRSFMTAVRLDGEDITITSFLDSPGGKDFLTELLSAHPVDRLFLQRVPADASSFSLFAVDGKRILRRLRSNLRPEMLAELERGLASMREGGLDLERDVLDVFGPRWAVVNLPRPANGTQGLDAIWNYLLGGAFVIEVTDPKEAQRVLGLLPKGDEFVQRHEHACEGYPAVTYRFEAGQVPPGFAVSYALVDDYLIVALSEDALSRMLRPRDPAAVERFRDLLDGVPETASVVSYDDMRHGLGLMADAFFSGLESGLPKTGPRQTNFAAMTDGLNPSISYTVADARGILSSTRSPTGGFGGVGGISGLFMLAAVAIPDFAVARIRTNEATALTTLRAIHAAEVSFRSNVVRDADGDEVGEYGFLAELMGEARPGDEVPSSREPLVGPFGRSERGDHEHKGYYFRVYLPAEDGSPIGGDQDPERLQGVDGDLAETVVAVVAWPAALGKTGRRAFVMDATGTIWACGDGPYGGAQLPPVDICNSQKGNLASTIQAPNGSARDGYTWLRVR